MFAQSITTSHPLVIAALEHSCPFNKASVCRYKLRAKVDIADVSSEYTTWARFGPGLMPEGTCSLYSNHTKADCRDILTASYISRRQCLACLPLLIFVRPLVPTMLKLAISPEHSCLLCTSFKPVLRLLMGFAQVNGKVTPGLPHWAKEQCCQPRVNLRHHLVSLKLKALNSKLGA
jgi:hypothetical protein